MKSLWGDEFNIPDTKVLVKKAVKKISQPKDVKESVAKTIKSKRISTEDKLKLITEEVEKILGVYKENTQVIREKFELISYINSAIDNGYIAIDTETNNSLDAITCQIMGACIYTPGRKNVYIPINHVDIITGERLPNQLTEQDLKEQFDRLTVLGTKIIMHNGKFDYSVIKCTCNCKLNIYWDTMIAAKVLDENEYSAGLKQQYIEKIDPSIQKYSIEHLFSDIQYSLVPINVFALYAATDPYMTFKLFEYQKKEFEKPGNERLYDLFMNVEMPDVEVLGEMQLEGMNVDQVYAKRLSKKYHKLLDETDALIQKELEKLKPIIDHWRTTEDANYHPPKKTVDGVGKSKNEQLEENINLASPQQLSILLYDVLNCPSVNAKSPRGTGVEELKSLSSKMKLTICDLILQRREYTKLLSTYIDVIPQLALRWPDGRVRTHFNQYGAATGRLSSSDPLNFQNIPAHNKEIRMLFTAKPGYKIVGGDFSAQEPRLTAFYSQDENMINAYLEGKDLYSVIAAKSFNKTYEECLEFYPEGTVIEYEGQTVTCGYKTHQNEEGKQRRSQAKSILLGVLYGRGAASIGEQIGKSWQEAQAIIDSFYEAFPKVKKWINESIEMAHKLGYVEDVAGRRRRLPDIMLDKFEVTAIKESTDFNPLLNSNGINPNSDSNKIQYYTDSVYKCKSKKEVDQLKIKAHSDGINIKDNTGYIAQAERQAVNSRVQGGAATLTKVALRTLYDDSRLCDMGARLINTVHDEILMEVPEQYSEECAKILTEDMVNSALNYVTNVPMKTDNYIVNKWYEDEYEVLVAKQFKKMLKKMTSLDAFEQLCQDRTECTRSQLYGIVHDMMSEVPVITELEEDNYE